MQMSGGVGLFVQQLELRRQRERLRHQQAAAAIGCSKSIWSRVIRGERPVSAQFARKALSRWPDLAVYYAADLASAGEAAGRAGRREESDHAGK